MDVVICFLHFWAPISISLSPCRSCSFIMTTPISFCHKIGQNTKMLMFNKSCWCFVPFVDKGTKSTCRSLKQSRRFLQPCYTQIHQVPGIINHVFVPFGNGWFIFGWLISRKFLRGCSANIGVHIFIQITPTWDVYNRWFIPRGNVGLGLQPRSFEDLFDSSAFSWCWTFSWSRTMHSNSKWE